MRVEVRRLQVAMNDALRMCEFERVNDTDEEFRQCSWFERSFASDPRIESFAVKEFEHQKR
jgi:hypothetical protein